MQLALGTLRDNGAIGDASLLAVDFCRAPATGRQAGVGRAGEEVQGVAVSRNDSSRRYTRRHATSEGRRGWWRAGVHPIMELWADTDRFG